MRERNYPVQHIKKKAVYVGPRGGKEGEDKGDRKGKKRKGLKRRTGEGVSDRGTIGGMALTRTFVVEGKKFKKKNEDHKGISI